MKTILVIEDESNILQNLQTILTLANYQVLTANNGQIGIELAKKYLPSLIVCDVMMPQLNGYEVLTILRENNATANIPFIFLTAKVERLDIRQGMELGADDYLTKPFETEELLKAIESRLQRQAISNQVYTQNTKQQQEKLDKIEKEMIKNKETIQTTEQINAIQDKIIKKLLVELSDPVSTINLAIKMLKDAQTEEKKEQYLKILEQECHKEMHLLNEITELQKLLTPDKVSILHKFNLLK